MTRSLFCSELCRLGIAAVCAAVLLAVSVPGVHAGGATPESAAGNANAALALSKESEHDYIIGPQNLLQIKIFGDASVNQIFRVDEGGFVSHPIAGRVKVAGQTVAGAEAFLEQKLTGDYYVNPKVTVFVLEHSRFSILGEVIRPGTYEIQGRVSVMEAISMAGGFSPIADKGAVKILRHDEAGESQIRVDMGQMMQKGDIGEEAYLHPDDTIVVAKSFF